MICKAKIMQSENHTRVFINGSEIGNISSLNLQISNDAVPTLTLEITPSELELEIDGVVIERQEAAEELVYMSMTRSEFLKNWLNK